MLFAVLGAFAGCPVSRPASDAVGTSNAGESRLPLQSGDLDALVEACEPRKTDTQANAERIRDCYGQHLVEILQTQGSTVGMLRLYQLAETSPRFAGLCHVTAHQLSELMYETVGNISEAMALCKEGCAHACQHAVLRTYLLHLPQGTLPDLREFCPRRTPDELSMSSWQCTHAVGHGLAHYYSDPHQALSSCRQFPLYWEHRRCIQGVFMELTVMTDDTHARSSPVPHTLHLCQTVKPDERFDCYNRLISLVGRGTGDATPRKFAACNAIPPSDRPGCYFGIGRSLPGSYLEREEEAARVCRSGDSTYTTDCLLGFASVLVNSTNLGRGFEFCGRLNHAARVRCAESMGRAVRLLSPRPDQVAAECAKAGEPVYVRACREVKITPDGLRSDLP